MKGKKRKISAKLDRKDKEELKQLEKSALKYFVMYEEEAYHRMREKNGPTW